MKDRKEKSGKKYPDYWLRNALFDIKFKTKCYHPASFEQSDIDSIKAAIAKDKEEERLFCKEVVRKKMKGNVENFGGGDHSTPQINKDAKARNDQRHRDIEKLGGL